MKIVIVLEGGLVQDVLSDVPVEYCTVDYDTECADEDRLTKIPQGDGKTAEAYAYSGNADVMPGRVDELFKAVQS